MNHVRVFVVVCLRVLLVSLGSNAVCLFPPFLQQHQHQQQTISEETKQQQQRDWRTGVRDQYTQFDYRVTFNGSLMIYEASETATTAGGKTPSLRRECLESVDEGKKYIVKQSAEREDGFEGEGGEGEGGEEDVEYLCMEFLQRSPLVVQMRSGSPRAWPDRGSCHEGQLRLDSWLLVDNAGLDGNAAVQRNRILCPLRGGFSVRIFHRMRQQGICDGYRGETRFESECARGGGMFFLFRHQNCVPTDLYMYSVQRTFCLASWHEDNFAFILLRHDLLHYAWILRYPTVLLEDSFTAHMFKDLVADVTEHVTETTNYLRLDTVRETPRPVTSLCVDEYEVCAVWNEPCTAGTQMVLTCPRTCGICNESRPVVCSFPPEMIGDWVDISGSSVAYPVQLSINRTTMTVTGGGGGGGGGDDDEGDVEVFHCVTWSPASTRTKAAAAAAASAVTDEMLVTEFSNGCRPRYTCVRIQRKSSAVILVKLSQTMTWPLTSMTSSPSTDADRIDCRMFSYDHDEATADRKLRSRHSRFMYLRDLRGFVPCRLPVGENQTLRDARGTECVGGSLSEINAGTGFMLNFTDCSSPPHPHPHPQRPSSSSASSVSFNSSSSRSRRPSDGGGGGGGVFYSGVFLCLKSSRVSPTGDLVLITRTDSLAEAVVNCWVYFADGQQLFWLHDRHCNETIKRQIRRDRLSPIAVVFRWPPSAASPAASAGAEGKIAAFADDDDDEDGLETPLSTAADPSSSAPPSTRRAWQQQPSLRFWTKTSDHRNLKDGLHHHHQPPPLNGSSNDRTRSGGGNSSTGIREESDPELESQVVPNAFVVLTVAVIFALLQIPCLCIVPPL